MKRSINTLFVALLPVIAVAAEPSVGLARPAVRPGTQLTPPGPPPPVPRALTSDRLQRRHIRGCPLGMSCKGSLLVGLREFERRAFPRPNGGSPWIDSDDAMGHGRARRGRRRTRRNPVAQKPTDLRPDLPWLARLNMPDLPVTWNRQLIKYLEFYKNDRRGRNIMSAWLRDQGKYRDMILRHLRSAGLPADLLYVAMIESSYNPREYSRAGASGLWQFMPAGAKIYGLTTNRWIDERRDPIQSTKAVLAYWTDLYQRFGNWELALAAYNAGYAGVLRAIAKYNTNDLWTLLEYENAMPWESTLYVPKAVAAAIVGHNRKLFGFDKIKIARPHEFDNVTVPTSVSLKVVARAAGTTVAEIKKLNPQLRRGRTPPRWKRYVLRVPRGQATLFAARFPQLRGDWDRYDAYVVRHGERFEDIATMHGIARYKLRKLNAITHESEARGGTLLVVPRVSAENKKKNLEKAKKKLYASGVPRGKKGDRLLVAVANKNLRVRGKRRVFYRVVSGDTLFGVARALGVSRRNLAAWNEVNMESHLHPRMILQAFVDKKLDFARRKISVLDESRITVVERGSPAHIRETETRIGRKRIVYRATRRESFKSIGRRFGLSDRSMARINRRSHRTVIEPGETCIVYAVVDAKRSKRARQQLRKRRRNNRTSRPRRKKHATKTRTVRPKIKVVSARAKKAAAKKKKTRIHAAALRRTR